MVRDPVVADDHEADEEAENLRPEVADRFRKVTGVFQLGDRDAHDEQGHRDREHRVAEIRGPVELEPFTVALENALGPSVVRSRVARRVGHERRR